MTQIALCICTRNRPEDLEKALASTRQSLLPPAQIIVSDDSDEAQAKHTAAVCAATPGVTYTRGPHRGLSANRNCCLDHLKAKIDAVAYIDDDVVIRPDFLGEAAKALQASPQKTIITGCESRDGYLITPHNCSFWGHQEVLPLGENDYHTIVINTALFPKELFTQARFDEALKYGSEEADMCAQAESLGYQIRFHENLVNDHYSSPVNRAEYALVIEASRLYSTYKRYKWLEKNWSKAAVYSMLAPLHLLGNAIKSRQSKDIPAAMSAIRLALGHAHDYNDTAGSRQHGSTFAGKRS